jgi:hypothetical protein
MEVHGNPSKSTKKAPSRRQTPIPSPGSSLWTSRAGLCALREQRVCPFPCSTRILNSLRIYYARRAINVLLINFYLLCVALTKRMGFEAGKTNFCFQKHSFSAKNALAPQHVLIAFALLCVALTKRVGFEARKNKLLLSKTQLFRKECAGEPARLHRFRVKYIINSIIMKLICTIEITHT